MKRIGYLLLFILSVLVGCSGLEKSERKKIRERNLTFRPIQRQSDELLFPKTTHPQKKRIPYPWEKKKIGSHLRITKEFFRCQGDILNPPIQIHRQTDLIYHLDCGGIETHTLPIKNGKEFIYPILIDLLNHVQEATEKKVVVTCGHRCPNHNLYADPSKAGRSSKHLIGAEVDFYVESLEHSPQVVIDTLLTYYKESLRRSETLSSASTPSWYNKEVAITLYHETEGRDFDNNHPYPYISIQVRYDRDNKRPVQYNWHEAHTSFIKY
ncbi:MAG: hypothetical protein KFB95_08715 [Simkaniaceae bacterium]|nr:MAG: hypothetical protein KFB95_08715 [Simkaniaceae bacterium]